MVRLALWIISRAMKKDPGFAWSWHCNVAMVGIDSGAEHRQANERAADFMKRAFGVDTMTQVRKDFPTPPGLPSPPNTQRIHWQWA